MQSCFLSYKSSVIHYLLAGKGERVLLCLHGYGETAGSFAPLEDRIADDHTMIAIDLPFHGETNWNEGLLLTSSDLLQMIELIMKEACPQSSRICLLGFSMGGRVALGLLPLIAEKIDQLMLLAPDGLTTNGWHWLATQNRLGNGLFRFTMRHPGWLLALLHASNRIKLIDPGVYKFTLSYMRNRQVRDELYRRWTTMRQFNNKKIKPFIVSNKIRVSLIYGEYDRIIKPRSGEKFRKGIESCCELHIVPCGHQVLQEKNLDLIIRLLKA